MDTEDIKTFVEVADAGGVSLASRRMGVSKSIVSRRLVRLERELGVQLFARTNKGAVLTEAGALFRDYAARVTAEIDTAKETILPQGDLQGRLRVSAPLSFGPTHIAPVLAEMGRRHPKLLIQACYTDRFVDVVAEGFDCAIRLGRLPDSNLVAKRFGAVEGTFVASPAYIAAHGAPGTPDEVAEHESLMQGTETWLFMDGDKLVTARPQGRYKADNATALVVACLAGLGLAYLPTELIKDHLASGALTPIMTRYPIPAAGAYVLRPAGQLPARKIRVLTDLLAEYCQEPHPWTAFRS